MPVRYKTCHPFPNNPTSAAPSSIKIRAPSEGRSSCLLLAISLALGCPSYHPQQGMRHHHDDSCGWLCRHCRVLDHDHSGLIDWDRYVSGGWHGSGGRCTTGLMLCKFVNELENCVESSSSTSSKLHFPSRIGRSMSGECHKCILSMSRSAHADFSCAVSWAASHAALHSSAAT